MHYKASITITHTICPWTISGIQVPIVFIVATEDLHFFHTTRFTLFLHKAVVVSYHTGDDIISLAVSKRINPRVKIRCTSQLPHLEINLVFTII